MVLAARAPIARARRTPRRSAHGRTYSTPRCASNRFPAGGAFCNASGFRPYGSPFRADAPAVDAGGQGLRDVACRTGAWFLGPRRPGFGIGFLVSMALVGAAVAVIVPIAVGYAAGHGEGEYAGHVRNGHARQRPPQRYNGACCQTSLGSVNRPIIAVRGSPRPTPCAATMSFSTRPTSSGTIPSAPMSTIWSASSRG